LPHAKLGYYKKDNTRRFLRRVLSFLYEFDIKGLAEKQKDQNCHLCPCITIFCVFQKAQPKWPVTTINEECDTRQGTHQKSITKSPV